MQLKQDFLELLSWSEEPPESKIVLVLVGQRVKHKFISSGEEEWYKGYILAYNNNMKTHEIVYKGDSQHNLIEDWLTTSPVAHMLLIKVSCLHHCKTYIVFLRESFSSG